jgi:nitrous oxide reductase
VILVAVIVFTSVVGAGYYLYRLSPSCGAQGGFLIVASSNGFNDSIGHQVPQTPWPVITVQKGANVTITVCNSDTQAHGFQITHYYDSSIVTVPPGRSLTISFLADTPGTFHIYCSIFCAIHAFMQNGELVVK